MERVALGQIYSGRSGVVTFIEDRVTLVQIYSGQSVTVTDL